MFVVRAWVVGRDEHFTQYIVRIPAETTNAYAINYLHVPAKNRDTDTRRLAVCIIPRGYYHHKIYKILMSMTCPRRQQH